MSNQSSYNFTNDHQAFQQTSSRIIHSTYHLYHSVQEHSNPPCQVRSLSRDSLMRALPLIKSFSQAHPTLLLLKTWRTSFCSWSKSSRLMAINLLLPVNIKITSTRGSSSYSLKWTDFWNVALMPAALTPLAVFLTMILSLMKRRTRSSNLKRKFRTLKRN